MERPQKTVQDVILLSVGPLNFPASAFPMAIVRGWRACPMILLCLVGGLLGLLALLRVCGRGPRMITLRFFCALAMCEHCSTMIVLVALSDRAY